MQQTFQTYYFIFEAKVTWNIWNKNLSADGNPNITPFYNFPIPPKSHTLQRFLAENAEQNSVKQSVRQLQNTFENDLTHGDEFLDYKTWFPSTPLKRIQTMKLHSIPEPRQSPKHLRRTVRRLK